MLTVPRCYDRNCKHFKGILQPDGTERTEVPYCEAFPRGIPADIAYGSNDHLKPIYGQTGVFVYENDKTSTADK